MCFICYYSLKESLNLPREVSSEWRCIKLALPLFLCFLLWEPTLQEQLMYTECELHTIQLTKDFNCTITFNPLKHLMKYYPH